MKITKAKVLKEKPSDSSKLGFGKIFTDHMLVMEYSENQGWGEPEIKPLEDFSMHPSTSVLHYAQGIFEGLKAFKNKDGEVRVFRPAENFKRMNRSAERMCIPPFDIQVAMDGLFELLKIEKDWIPTDEGTALYIRPSIVAVDSALGVHAGKKYIFFIILSPVGAYYSNGFAPVKIFVEDYYSRTAVGGTGEAKCIGNYAASLIAAEKAQKKGYDQVLWLDSNSKKYAEEVGSMNIFFVINGEVITPELSGTILPGITRMSSIQLLRDKGYKVTERKIAIKEVIKAAKRKKLDEVFGTGTAAVISPVGLIGYKGENYKVGDGEMGKITTLLYDNITGIQRGVLDDKFDWTVKV